MALSRPALAEAHSFARYITAIVLCLGISQMLQPTASGKEVASTVNQQVSVEGLRTTFDTQTMTVEVASGVVTKIFNKLTGTEYLPDAPAGLAPQYATGLVYLKEGQDERGENALIPDPLPIDKLSQVQCTQRDDGVVRFTLRCPDNGTTLELAYQLEPESGDLLVSQKACGSRKALAGVRFGLGPVTCRGELLLPCYHGMKANTTEQFLHWEGLHWDWPWVWPLQLAIFQETLGGLWIHSEDSVGRFKTFHYHPEGNGRWLVSFDTLNLAPLKDHTSAESVAWRIDTFEGGWSVPVDRFKQWANQAYRIGDKAFARPAWVDEIRLQIKHADYIPEEKIGEYLDLLATLVKPSETLLYMTQWYEKTQPLVLPNWKLKPKGIAFNTEARRRGFRTMYFSNYLGISPDHPRIAEFKPYLVRNPYTGQHEGWNLRPDDWSRAGGSFQLYYVNPAAKEWREYQVSAYRAVFDACPADGLFLDQTYNIWNDGNGLIQGMTMIEGNVAFHRELAEALPGIALGGENVSEITYPYESFFEMHPLSFEYTPDESGKHRWRIAPEAFDRMVPIMTRFLEPHTRPFGYLGFPDTSSSFYPGMRDAVEKYHGIPTLTRPTFDEMKNPESEVRRVMRTSMKEKS